MNQQSADERFPFPTKVWLKPLLRTWRSEQCGHALFGKFAAEISALPDASALISFGESSIVAIGDPERRREGGGWVLEAHSRDERGTRLTKIRVRDRALSVSSSVGKVSVIDGERVSHVVDPRTGTTVPGAVEAVVVGERAGEVDAWSTALLVLGAQRDAMRLVERAGLEAYVFEAAGRIAVTPGFEALEAPER